MRRGMKLGGLLITASIVLAGWTVATGRISAEASLDGLESVDWTNNGDASQVITSSSVEIPANVTEIVHMSNYNGSNGSAAITDIVIDGSPVIHSSAFNGNSSLSNVNLGGTVEIGEQAFANTGISSINVPASATSIHPNAFAGAPILSNITVDESNPNYYSYDGCLYTYNGGTTSDGSPSTTLVFVPQGKGGSITIASNCTNVPAMVMTDTISSIRVPATVTNFGTQGIPAGLTEIIYEGSDLQGDILEVAYAARVNETNPVIRPANESGTGGGGGTTGGGDTDPDPGHTHNYATAWSYDATNHWHKCDTCDSKKDEATHTYGDWTTVSVNGTVETQERTCSVCGYKATQSVDLSHTHTYNTSTWTYDATYHWHQGSCGHDVQADRSPHGFSDWVSAVEKTETGNITTQSRYCVTCGYTESKTTTTRYVVNKDGTITKTSHTKDTTPKTADGFDTRYLLCLAFFLTGVAAIILSKQKKITIAAERINNR